MSFYGFDGVPNPRVGGLRIHSPDDSYGAQGRDHVAASLAALNANSSGSSARGPDSLGSPTEYRPQSPYSNADSHPAALLAPGGPMADQRPSLRTHDSLFLS